MTKVEIEKGFQEIWELFKETDKRFKETDSILEKRFKETDSILERIRQETAREIDRTSREVEKTSKEVEKTSKEVEKTSKEVEKTSKEVERTSREVANLTGKWGRFVEGLIVPATEELFKDRGIEVNTIYQRVKRHKEGEAIEIDILAIDGTYAVLIEAKSTLKIEDVNEHINRLSSFKRFFPEYADKKVVGAVGGIVIDEESDKYAYRKGMFVITQRGNSVKITNDNKFEPALW